MTKKYLDKNKIRKGFYSNEAFDIFYFTGEYTECTSSSFAICENEGDTFYFPLESMKVWKPLNSKNFLSKIKKRASWMERKLEQLAQSEKP